MSSGEKNKMQYFLKVQVQRLIGKKHETETEKQKSLRKGKEEEIIRQEIIVELFSCIKHCNRCFQLIKSSKQPLEGFVCLKMRILRQS